MSCYKMHVNNCDIIPHTVISKHNILYQLTFFSGNIDFFLEHVLSLAVKYNGNRSKKLVLHSQRWRGMKKNSKFQVLEGILFVQTVQLVRKYKYHEEKTIQTIQIQREGEVFCL